MVAAGAWANRTNALPQVVVLMSADVKAYHNAVRGFDSQFSHQKLATYDMKGDMWRGRRFMSEIKTKYKPDLVLVVGVWALKVVKDYSGKTPLIYTMVLNPPSIIGSAQLAGASMNVPAKKTLMVLKQLDPAIKRIGVIYNEKTTGYLVREAQKVAKEHDQTIVARPIKSSREINKALKELQARDIHVLWIPPDKNVLALATFKQFLKFSHRRHVPLLGLSQRHAKMGALLSLSFASSYDIGMQSGEVAQRIVDGEPAAQVSYTKA
jgi:ABC-type uncharacterized transport system substrate-binding protein